MKCSACGFQESKVVDSRQSDDGYRIKRRRECLSCGVRFTTFEVIETTTLVVVKRDNSRQPFDRRKLVNGLMRACEKRPISIEIIENLVSEIECYYSNALVKEVTSKDIGELVLQKLKEVDDVAYVRFASVYKEFSSVQAFLNELNTLTK